jgi:hypothetical protein
MYMGPLADPPVGQATLSVTSIRWEAIRAATSVGETRTLATL